MSEAIQEKGGPDDVGRSSKVWTSMNREVRTMRTIPVSSIFEPMGRASLPEGMSGHLSAQTRGREAMLTRSTQQQKRVRAGGKPLAAVRNWFPRVFSVRRPGSLVLLIRQTTKENACED